MCNTVCLFVRSRLCVCYRNILASEVVPKISFLGSTNLVQLATLQSGTKLLLSRVVDELCNLFFPARSLLRCVIVTCGSECAYRRVLYNSPRSAA